MVEWAIFHIIFQHAKSIVPLYLGMYPPYMYVPIIGPCVFNWASLVLPLLLLPSLLLGLPKAHIFRGLISTIINESPIFSS